jgi:hypothetical protein
MSYASLTVILLVLVIGAAVTLTVLFRSSRKGHFRNLKSGAYVIFDEDEPLGEAQDQVFREEDGAAGGDGASAAVPERQRARDESA